MKKFIIIILLNILLVPTAHAYKADTATCTYAKKSFYNLSDNLQGKWWEFKSFLRTNNIKYYSGDDYYIGMIGTVLRPTNYDIGRPSTAPDDKRIYVKFKVNNPAKQLPMALYVIGKLQGSVLLEPCGYDGQLGANDHTFAIRALKGRLKNNQYLLAHTSIGASPPGHMKPYYRPFSLNIAEYIVIPDTSFNSANAHLLEKLDSYINMFSGSGHYAGNY